MTTDTEARELVERLTDFAPGPWHYRPQKYDDWGYVRGPQEDDGWSTFICQAKDPRSSEDDERLARRNGTDPWEATARLIAAAPDMHRLLTALLAEVERLRAERDAAWNDAIDAALRHSFTEGGCGTQVVSVDDLLRVLRKGAKMTEATNSQAYEYIARIYGTVFRPGDKVRHTASGHHGKVKRPDIDRSHYVRVHFGTHGLGYCHPSELDIIHPAAQPVEADDD